MSESKDDAPESRPDADPDKRGDPAAQGESFTLPDPAQVEATKLRRRLFGGYRPDDVESALRTREEQIAELRRDVAALWLAFGQHERTIQDMLVALERLAGVGVDPPGARADEMREPAGGDAAPDTPTAAPDTPTGETTRGEDAVGLQLGDLDQILVAIEEATQSLERTYHEEIVAREEGAEPGGGEQREDAGGGAEDSQEGDSGQDPAEGASGQGTADAAGDEAGEDRPGT
jgi:hypothetical protein